MMSDIQIIFTYLPITIKRNFIRTCKPFHEYAIQMPKIEKEFQAMIVKTKFFYTRNYTNFTNPLYKYSIELIYDNYPIPDKYVIPENRIMHQYKKIYYQLAIRGNLDMLKKLLSLNRNNCLGNNADYAMEGASFSGNLEILKWMEKNGYKFNRFTVAYASKGNQFETLRWLFEHKCPHDELCVAYACELGNIDMVKWLLDVKKCKIDSYPICLAGSSSHFDIVKYLYEKYPKLDYEFTTSVGKSGHLNILQWGNRK